MKIRITQYVVSYQIVATIYDLICDDYHFKRDAPLPKIAKIKVLTELKRNYQIGGGNFTDGHRGLEAYDSQVDGWDEEELEKTAENGWYDDPSIRVIEHAIKEGKRMFPLIKVW